MYQQEHSLMVTEWVITTNMMNEKGVIIKSTVVATKDRRSISKTLRAVLFISIEYGSDSPSLCGEERKLQSESLGSGVDLFPYPVRLRRGS
jgi:hypothetical protein